MNFVLYVGGLSLFIIICALIIFIVYIIQSLYSKFNKAFSTCKSKILTGLVSIIITIILLFSFYSANIYLRSVFSKLTIVDYTSKISVGDEAHIVVKGKPNEKYIINVIGYFYDHPDNVISDSNGIAVFSWTVTYSIKPMTYNVDIYDEDINDIVSTKITIED